ncbi:murein biosynthesis integral membrane protein MurJ [Streptomyces agglomeratus]|uniref:Murein biosynthesis integral membrane protein MurJ n=1 Tax=Streptomyces agglomeratus TaxID=285458 RepID=A0A1E5PCA2_9ACTN|nr:murein biosynthesis integral membrane protein MurJ [Streptomyces agglomeratus]OEJ27024.1 murein biosynthesis integral membrane protein MurJ [Streptomyces agglomeratus]OEJ38926.1 murein biosynthesis integral membrane protein MurJ [Streptomyces agglomeratus]OEJ46690.1 murein biosynthesis integral membrane protein MurJ [Streptomyces agglomeratus]OEJ51455.1 murein biosynthesis integral membrane protein MurJ [Streptomyces agglomeratus]OEJ58857.1 murein biosynthesis integral membrane protein MurJ
MSTTTLAAPKPSSVLRSGALMAAGSVVSRATGFVRSAVVAAALGVGVTADGYAVGNTVPTIVYMLLLGGALNAVFVPELVKAAKEHEDGGAAYTDRLLTVCVVALLAITGGAVLAAPAIVDTYTSYTGARADMTVAFARYCLPQIFFLGLFTLLGQVLNARGRFGAMMWTPVLNNVVVIAVFGLYLGLGLAARSDGILTPGRTALLGWGTTAGIAVQALALLPVLRAARFRWRPRFDWRGSGLTRPMRAAGWLVLLVLTNQAAYWVVTRLATSAGERALALGIDGGVGFSAYNNAYLLWAVPHGIVTVSLVTALVPRMSGAAADGDGPAVRRDVSYALRTSAAAVVPAACALLALAQPLMALVFQYGRTGADDIAAMSGILMAFAPGLIAFSGQYVLSRAFYALRDTRTPFLLNLVIAALNAGLSTAAYLLLPARWAVTGMAGAYSLALCAGWALTAYTLHRRLPPDRTAGRSPSLAAHARLLAAAVPAAVLGHLAAGWASGAGAPAATAAGAAAILAVFAALAKPLRLTEVDALLTGAVRRLRR